MSTAEMQPKKLIKAAMPNNLHNRLMMFAGKFSEKCQAGMIAVFLCIIVPLSTLAQNRNNRPTVIAQVVDRYSGHSVGWASLWSYEEGKPQALKVSYSKQDGTITWQTPRSGLYKLVFRAEGYFSDSLIITISADTTLSTVGLIPNLEAPSRLLEEVTVTAERPLLSHLIDRYVYDVSRDPEAGKKKMSEIMEKIPGINVNTPTGLLQYNGISFAQILIDGERHQMINSSLQFPMRMIRADVMNKIEIIPPGSPQYNNDRPILNIITSRALPNGYAFELSGDANSEHTYNGKLDFISKIRDAVIVHFGYTPAFSNPLQLHNNSLRELFNGSGSLGSQQSEGVSDGYSRSRAIRFGTSFKILGNAFTLNANTSLGESGNNNEMAIAFLDETGAQQSRRLTESHNTTKFAYIRFKTNPSIFF